MTASHLGTGRKRPGLSAILRCVTMSLFFCAAVPLPCVTTAATDYTIDSAHTVVSFELRTFGIYRQRGRFGTTRGSVSLDPQSDSGRFEIVIDARSVQASSDAIVRIMRSEGLLNVEQYPTIAYSAARVMFFNDQPVRIDGELTLLGITRSVPLMVTGYRCAGTRYSSQHCRVNAAAVFKRSEFGMIGYRAFASDKVKLAVEAEAVSDNPGRIE